MKRLLCLLLASLVPVYTRPRRVLAGICPKIFVTQGSGTNVPNEIVIEAMIKGLRPGPTAQYFARKPPQTLENLLQKMDEYIRVNNDFLRRREKAYRYSEMTRGFERRLHSRHVRMIHNPRSSDDRGNHTQGHQHTSQSSGTPQSSFRPPA